MVPSGLVAAGRTHLRRIHRNPCAAKTLRDARFLREKRIHPWAAMFAREVPARLDRRTLTAALTDRQPRSAVVAHVCGARFIEMREGDGKLAIRDSVNEKMHERGAVGSLPRDVAADHLQIPRELEREII